LLRNEYYILQVALFTRNRKRLSEIEGSVSATTELADNLDSPDRNEDEPSRIAESDRPSPNADCKEHSGLSLEEFRNLGWDEFLRPEDSRRNVDPSDR
jgi:hypothetical protein